MLRIGEIVTDDKNPLMNVSKEYQGVVKKLANFSYSSDEIKLLACLIVSQTEHQYKKYLINVLQRLDNLPIKQLIDDWQKGTFEVDDSTLRHLFSKEEFLFIKEKNIEEDLQKHESQSPNLFNDGLITEFYPNKKKGMLYLRRLATHYLKNYQKLNSFQKLVFHFIVAQMLVSWESSCIHLGTMILDVWEAEKISKWFCQVWPIYKK